MLIANIKGELQQLSELDGSVTFEVEEENVTVSGLAPETIKAFSAYLYQDFTISISLADPT